MIIYLAHNLVNNKNYIGQTVQKIYNRRYGHYKSARDGKGYSFPRALLKYKREDFVWSILRECDNVEEMNLWEELYIKLLNSTDPQYGYNIYLKSGSILSEETRHKISEKAKGNKRSKGRVWTKEQKEALSQIKKKWCKDNPDKIAKLTQSNIGRIASEETKRKIGEKSKGNKNCLGRKITEQHRENLSKSHIGNIPTEETKRRMSESHCRRWENTKNNSCCH